jgi:hypothetical protein
MDNVQKEDPSNTASSSKTFRDESYSENLSCLTVLQIYPVPTLPAIIWSALLPIHITQKFCDKFDALVFKSQYLYRPNNSLGFNKPRR